MMWLLVFVYLRFSVNCYWLTYGQATSVILSSGHAVNPLPLPPSCQVESVAKQEAWQYEELVDRWAHCAQINTKLAYVHAILHLHFVDTLYNCGPICCLLIYFSLFCCMLMFHNILENLYYMEDVGL